MLLLKYISPKLCAFKTKNIIQKRTILKISKNYVNASIPKEKTGVLSFFESFILMERLTV